MPGFPREEQMLLAALVGAHRRKIVMVENDELMPPWHMKAQYLMLLLRLAVLLHRGRSAEQLPPITRATARPVSHGGVSARLAEGSSAHSRGSAERGRALEGDRLQAAGVRLYALTPICPGAA